MNKVSLDTGSASLAAAARRTLRLMCANLRRALPSYNASAAVPPGVIESFEPRLGKDSSAPCISPDFLGPPPAERTNLASDCATDDRHSLSIDEVVLICKQQYGEGSASKVGSRRSGRKMNRRSVQVGGLSGTEEGVRRVIGRRKGVGGAWDEKAKGSRLNLIASEGPGTEREKPYRAGKVQRPQGYVTGLPVKEVKEVNEVQGLCLTALPEPTT
eukprot:767021-Hanusia_phi.AAC.1